MTPENVWINPAFVATRPKTAVFADRDGTLIRHIDYVDDPRQIELLPGVKKSIQRLFAAHIPLFIVTNQSGVGRGYSTIEQVHACQSQLFKQLGVDPSELAGWCIAPEKPGTEGGYRKPSPRYIEEACHRLGIQSSRCHMIGDTRVDLETAWNSGASAWAVACGKPELPREIAAGSELGPHTLKDDFAACVEAILPP